MTAEFATPHRARSHIPLDPGKPYFIEKGMGDRAYLFGDLFTIYAGASRPRTRSTSSPARAPRATSSRRTRTRTPTRSSTSPTAPSGCSSRRPPASSTRSCWASEISASCRRTARTPTGSSGTTAGSLASQPVRAAPSSGSSKPSAHRPSSKACHANRSSRTATSSALCRRSTTSDSCPITGGALRVATGADHDDAGSARPPHRAAAGRRDARARASAARGAPRGTPRLPAAARRRAPAQRRARGSGGAFRARRWLEGGLAHPVLPHLGGLDPGSVRPAGGSGLRGGFGRLPAQR